MNRITVAVGELGAVASGMLDVIFAFSLALERKGLMDRGEIVDLLAQVQSQVEAQQAGPTGRSAVVELMLQALRMPVAGEQARSRLRVIADGRQDE